MANPSGQKL